MVNVTKSQLEYKIIKSYMMKMFTQRIHNLTEKKKNLEIEFINMYPLCDWCIHNKYKFITMETSSSIIFITCLCNIMTYVATSMESMQILNPIILEWKIHSSNSKSLSINNSFKRTKNKMHLTFLLNNHVKDFDNIGKRID